VLRAGIPGGRGAVDVESGYIELTILAGAVHAGLAVVDSSSEDSAYTIAIPAPESAS
jgi:hypothetical protein